MKTLSNLSTALIIASAILLAGNLLTSALTTIATASIGFIASSTPDTRETLLYLLSALFFLSGIAIAVVSVRLEKK